MLVPAVSGSSRGRERASNALISRAFLWLVGLDILK